MTGSKADASEKDVEKSCSIVVPRRAETSGGSDSAISSVPSCKSSGNP